MVNSRTPINERQTELLERIAGGDTLSSAADVKHRRSAYALRDRGLVTVSKRAGVFTAQVTDRGRHHLDHDHYPGHGDRTASVDEHPRPVTPPHTSRDHREDGAPRSLIDRLQSAEDKTLTITDPDAPTRASYRRAIHAAKLHSLVPEGYLLRHSGRTSGDLVIRLLNAAQPHETDWNRVRLNLRKPAPTPQDLGTLLDENPAALSVSDAQRARARQFLLDLAAAAARRGHMVKLTRRGQHAKLGYVVTEKKQWSLELHEEHDEVPRTPPRGRARAWQSWGYTPTDKVPSGRLRLVVHTGPGDPDKAGRWADDKRTTLEKRIPSIVRDLQARHDEQVRAHEEWRREWERQQAEQARRHAAEKIEWDAAIARARPQAVDALRQATLLAALGAWRDAQDMREICSVLGQAADTARDAGQEELAANLLAWQEGGLALADSVDPTRGSASFAHLPFALEPTADDLRPFLDGWNPRTPGRDYYTGPREHKPSKPWPDAWEQFQR